MVDFPVCRVCVGFFDKSPHAKPMKTKSFSIKVYRCIVKRRFYTYAPPYMHAHVYTRERMLKHAPPYTHSHTHPPTHYPLSGFQPCNPSLFNDSEGLRRFNPTRTLHKYTRSL